MTLFDKLESYAKNIGDKTNEALEISKLAAQINTEQNLAAEQWQKIGEYYYNLYVKNGEAAKETVPFCEAAKAHLAAAKDAADAIEKIKAEADAREKAAAEANFSLTQTAQTTAAIICSICHAPIPEGQKFCSECGTKVEISETKKSTGSTAKVCPGCGAQGPDGRKFCGECGTKVDSGIQANPTHCKNCGAEIPRGRKFCGECGFRVS